jgi:hypothetical protein
VRSALPLLRPRSRWEPATGNAPTRDTALEPPEPLAMAAWAETSPSMRARVVRAVQHRHCRPLRHVHLTHPRHARPPLPTLCSARGGWFHGFACGLGTACRLSSGEDGRGKGGGAPHLFAGNCRQYRPLAVRSLPAWCDMPGANGSDVVSGGRGPRKLIRAPTETS